MRKHLMVILIDPPLNYKDLLEFHFGVKVSVQVYPHQKRNGTKCVIVSLGE